MIETLPAPWEHTPRWLRLLFFAKRYRKAVYDYCAGKNGSWGAVTFSGWCYGDDLDIAIEGLAKECGELGYINPLQTPFHRYATKHCDVGDIVHFKGVAYVCTVAGHSAGPTDPPSMTGAFKKLIPIASAGSGL